MNRLLGVIGHKSEEMRALLIKRESVQSAGVFHEIEDAIREVAVSKGMDLLFIYEDVPDEKDRNLSRPIFFFD